MGNRGSKKNEEKGNFEYQNHLQRIRTEGGNTSSSDDQVRLNQAAKFMAPVTVKEEPRVSSAGANSSRTINGAVISGLVRLIDTGGSLNSMSMPLLQRDQSRIPKEYLNKLGFISYNHHGLLPWLGVEDVLLSKNYTSNTTFLGIDCEMVGVGHLKSSALGRVSIVNEYGFCIYDEFVMPKKQITDYRTPFSGIRAEDLTKARGMDLVVSEVRAIVENRILVGHSIHNDLEVLELNNHPPNMIRDTAIYHKRLAGSKSTPSLKDLTHKYLGLKIQDGEHSSIQDAQATMKLYLIHRNEWEKSLSESRVKANLTDLDFSDLIMAPPVDITQMNVCPREKDIFADSRTIFVRENKTLGSYSSSAEYRDVQFRLLLEDLYRPLREGVSNAKHYSSNKRKTPKAGMIFNSVRILGDNTEVKGKKTLMIPIELNNLGAVDWEDSKLFLNGSLLLLTPDNFKSVKFASITWRPHSNKQSYGLHLKVTFSKDGPSWIIKEGDRFKMMESVAFYEAYRHTLEYLQVMKLDSFPMKKYIVDAEMQPVLPKYLQNLDVLFDFSVFVNNTTICNGEMNHLKSQILDFNNWPTASQLNFDNSQYEAFQKAVTQEFTIIQGPPGTGKTFIAIQVVKFLLSNPHLLKSPILIVSYTNHALDQMLEGILDFVTQELCKGNLYKAHQRILRIGGGCKSEIVEPMCLKYKKDKKTEKKKSEVLNKAIKNFQDFEKLSKQGVIDFNQLHPDIIEQLSLKYKDIWGNWVNAVDSIKKNPSDWFGLPNKKLLENAKTKSGNNFIILLPSCELPIHFRPLLLGGDEFEQQMKTLDDSMESSEFIQQQTSIAFTAEAQSETYNARWIIYMFLVLKVKEIGQAMISKAKQSKEALNEIKSTKNNKASNSLVKIVGMTTTGAVKYKKMVVNSFKSQVMIVEEAAHVLEAHVVASLTQHCQQMIMIGDHKQLRPMTADNTLAKNYKLEISLMERLVENGKAQGVQNWVQLKLQHRMRPEIAKMVCPVIYEHLENHPVVYQYPDVKGCAENLFFIDHTMEEKRELRSSSLINEHEASFLSQLCYYLIAKGYYNHSQITVIATYSDQKLLLQKKLVALPGCSDVRISTVDGYQGEENDIILLSLVRSNINNLVGFLKTDNRVCVALSRARHGLFMMGNMSCLKQSSETWSKIHNILKENNNIGSGLDVKCPLHGYITKVSAAVEFNRISCPGCSNKNRQQVAPHESSHSESEVSVTQLHKEYEMSSPINTNSFVTEIFTENYNNGIEVTVSPIPVHHDSITMKLSCGHIYVGKMPLNENKLKCLEVIEKQLPCGHLRKLHCYENVNIINCKELITKTLSCGHTHSLKTPCSRDISKIKCIVPVSKSLPCGHQQIAHCHQNVDSILCSKLVEKTLSCGHKYPVKSCSEDISKLKCIVPVPKSLPCGHQQIAHCHQNVDSILCSKLVEKTLSCGHKYPVKSCSEDISKLKCIVPVPKSLPCGHQQIAHCHQNVDSIRCSKLVKKTLSCGHKYPAKSCSEDISKLKCIVPVPKSLPCGHQQIAHCHLEASKINCHVQVSGCEVHKKVVCYKRRTIICKNIVCRLLLCNHTAMVPCSKELSEIKCISLVSKSLPCGHKQLIHCHQDEFKIQCNKRITLCEHLKSIACHQRFETTCKETVKKVLQCEHKIEVPCIKKLAEIKCMLSVEKVLPCGHKINLHCYQKDFKIQCSIPVKLCEHLAAVLCHNKSTQKPSEIKCLLVLPKKFPCGHIQKYPCFSLSNHNKCGQLVTKLLPCGHEYKNKIHCHQSVPEVKCKVSVSVRFPLCKHEVVVQCHAKERTICKSDCNKKFKCGHSCQLQCHVSTNPDHKCLEMCIKSCPRGHLCPGDHMCHTACTFRSKCPVKYKNMLQCGHGQDTPCHEYGAASRDKACEECDLARVIDSIREVLADLKF